jgi:hypothetical protein
MREFHGNPWKKRMQSPATHSRTQSEQRGIGSIRQAGSLRHLHDALISFNHVFGSARAAVKFLAYE